MEVTAMTRLRAGHGAGAGARGSCLRIFILQILNEDIAVE